MNYIIDIVILLCLGGGAFKGFKKGFIIQSFVIIALVLAIWGGFALSGMLEPFMRKNFQMGDLACSVVSFIVIFLLILILVYTSGYLVTKVANAASLGLINRLAGAAFGVFANALILSVIIMLLDRINSQKHFMPDDKLAKTCLYGPVGKFAPAIFPENFFTKVKNTLS